MPIDVFFITGRKQTERSGEMARVCTLRNLDVAGYGPVSADHLYLRDVHAPGRVADYKSSSRGDVESKGFTIIANIGGQYSDLAKGYAEMTFKLPNPFTTFLEDGAASSAREAFRAKWSQPAS